MQRDMSNNLLQPYLVVVIIILKVIFVFLDGFILIFIFPIFSLLLFIAICICLGSLGLGAVAAPVGFMSSAGRRRDRHLGPGAV